MVDIQSLTGEIRRGKKEKEITGWKYNVLICYANTNNSTTKQFGAAVVTNSLIRLVFQSYSRSDQASQDSLGLVEQGCMGPVSFLLRRQQHQSTEGSSRSKNKLVLKIKTRKQPANKQWISRNKFSWLVYQYN